MEFLFLMRSVNSNVKLRKVFLILFQCLISSIWLKIHFLKPFFVVKKSLIFHEIFLPKVPLATIFKNSGICEYCSIFKAKINALWALSIGKTRKTEIMEYLFLKYSWNFMDMISHSETSLPGKFYIYQKNSVLLMKKKVNFAFFLWSLLGHSKKTQT